MPTNPLSTARSARRPATGWQLVGAWLLAMVCLVLALLLPAVPAHAEALPRAIGAHAACAWDEPGRRPFNKDLVAAVARYTDIPRAERTRLQQRMTAHRYDDFVEIRRDRIVGRHRYLPAIRDMLFGDGRRCAEVSRTQWPEQTLARGLVYCEGAYCLLVPTAGRNLSRIQRDDSEGSPAARAAAGAAPDSSEASGPVAGAVPAPLPAEVPGELVFDPPAAGLPDAADDSFVAGARPDAWNNPLVVLGGGGYLAGSTGGSGGPGSGGSAGGSTGGNTGSGGSAGGEGAGGAGGAPWGGSGGGAVPETPAGQLPPVVPAVPEPGTWALMALGLLGLVIVQRRQAARR